MKKTLVAAALLGAFAGVAQAQTAVQIYGNVDVGVSKRSDQTVGIGKRAANTLGFKGTEDLGNGLKALFQVEMRYEPDTGTTENNGRPLFQGQSRVGLQGDFGTVRLGRGLTPFQEIVGSFEPWHGLPTQAGFYTDISVAGFNSAPLDANQGSAQGSAQGNTTASANTNRISNAIFYTSPISNGFQVSASWASKEGNGGTVTGTGLGAASYLGTNPQASANPFSVAGTFNNGPFGAMLAYERNAVESKVWSAAGSVSLSPELKLMGTVSRQNQNHTNTERPTIKAAEIGLTYAMGPGKVLTGFGIKKQSDEIFDRSLITRQYSLGYEYSLSKRTYLYVDASRKTNWIDARTGTQRTPANPNFYDIGLNHSF